MCEIGSNTKLPRSSARDAIPTGKLWPNGRPGPARLDLVRVPQGG
jgi:hypothetical protein